MKKLILPVLALALTACGSTTIETRCDSAELDLVCGIVMPEDLEPLPNEGGVLIAEYGDFGNLPGAFSWIDPAPRPVTVKLPIHPHILTQVKRTSARIYPGKIPPDSNPHELYCSFLRSNLGNQNLPANPKPIRDLRFIKRIDSAQTLRLEQRPPDKTASTR